jgi:hypothetical protein
MASRSRQTAASTIAAQSIELREEPRLLIASHPTKALVFASDDDEPPAYINDTPYRTRDQHPRAHVPRGGNWRAVNGTPSVYSPPPSTGHDSNGQQATTKEIPLIPNRRETSELGREAFSPTSQVLLPASASNRPRRKKSSGGNSAKNWLKNIKSPIGEFYPRFSVPLISLR